MTFMYVDNDFAFFERLFQLADEFGLRHQSSGNYQNRYITVIKSSMVEHEVSVDDKAGGGASQIGTQQPIHTTKTGDCADIHVDLPEIDAASGDGAPSKEKVDALMNSQATEINAETLTDIIKCPNCEKEVPKSNYELHEIRCRIDKTETSVKPKTSTDQKPKSSKSKKKNKKKTTKDKASTEDFDALMAEATLLNTVCNFVKCKNYTTTLGQNCMFCAKRFCVSHHIPESHGCGDAAKTRARTMLVKEGVLYRGSGIPDKKLDPQKKVYLQRKLDEKLNKMTDARKVQKKEK